MEASESPERSARDLPDATLGGYLRTHERPPAFEGSDGHPYTVSLEVEQVGDLTAPYACYLVFPRWAMGGAEVVGHVQTPLLAKGRSRDEAVEPVGELPLTEVKRLLEEAIDRARERRPRTEEEWSSNREWPSQGEGPS